MTSFAKLEFFRLFDRLVRPAPGAQGERRWTIEGVEWRQTHQTSTTADYTLTLDIIVGERRGRNGWSIMVAREDWWTGDARDPFRSSQWAHMVAGKRAHALAWFDRLDGLAGPTGARQTERRPGLEGE